MTKVDPGWTSIIHDPRRGGLVYRYPDGHEIHVPEDEIKESVHSPIPDTHDAIILN